jgi:hypothetical protein
MRLHRFFHPTLLLSEGVQFLLSPGVQFHLSPDTVDLASDPARVRFVGSMTKRFGRRWSSFGRHPIGFAGKRLKPLLPVLIEGMEQHGHLQLATEIRAALLRVSAVTIDRALRRVREQAGGRPRRRAVPSAVRRSVPVRTFSD